MINIVRLVGGYIGWVPYQFVVHLYIETITDIKVWNVSVINILYVIDCHELTNVSVPKIILPCSIGGTLNLNRLLCQPKQQTIKM